LTANNQIFSFLDGNSKTAIEMSQEQHRAMMSPDAAGVGPQLRCFRLAGLTQEGTKMWTRDKEAEHATGVAKKFVHPPATGELDVGNGKRHGKQPDDAIRVEVTAPERPNYTHEAKEDFYPARQLQCSPERPDGGKRVSPSTTVLTVLGGC
jgi:hypothetical protein